MNPAKARPGLPPSLADRVAKLYREYRHQMINVALRRAPGCDETLAEDVVHEALVRILSGKVSLPGWEDSDPATDSRIRKRVLRTIVNVAREVQRREKVRATVDLPGDASLLIGDGTTARSLCWKLRAQAGIDEALASLTPSEREVVRLRCIEGLSHAEIAARRQSSRNTCKNQWASARKKLRSCLGGTYTDGIP